MRSRWAAIMAAMAVVVGLAGGAVARAEPLTVSNARSAKWSGGPYLAPTPLAGDVLCPAGPEDPTCHHQVIDVRADGQRALEIVVDAKDDTDLDIVVFDAAGNRMATAGSTHDPEVLTMAVTSGHYTVSVGGFATSWDSPSGFGRFRATAAVNKGDEPRSSLPCATSVPDGPVDSDVPLDLSVLVLLDGISLERGRAIVRQARTSYDDAGIALTVAFDDTFEARKVDVGIDFQGNRRARTDSSTMFEDARNHVGGAVPDPHDAVVVMTAKDLNDNGSDYMGVANCLGALGSPTEAFALGEAWADERDTPSGHQADLSAVIWSHELGHLANAAHHYGECTMGLGRADAGDGTHVGHETCSLMQYIAAPGLRTVTTSNLYFSRLNRAVVRAHVAHHRG